jgi:hypothetical protein
MLLASYPDPWNQYSYGQEVYNFTDKVQMANSVHAQAFQQGSCNASTWAGSDMDSLSSAESYCTNTDPMGYMMYGGSVAHQQQEQGYVVPVQMMPMVVAMIPTAMPMPIMAGGRAMPVASPPRPLSKGMSESPQKDEESPAGEKATRRLEDLLPGGRRSTREDVGRKVFVGGLNPTTTTQDLLAYFSSFGVVTDSCVITDSMSNESRGFGFVEFADKIPEGLFDKTHIIDQRRCGVREYSQGTSS